MTEATPNRMPSEVSEARSLLCCTASTAVRMLNPTCAMNWRRQLGEVHRTGGGTAMPPRGAVSPPATGRLSRTEAGRRVSAMRS